MRTPRLTVAVLMAWVGLAAVGLAVLKYPTLLGASLLGTALQGSILVALLGAILRRRPAWIGFALFGGTYTALAFDLAVPPLPRPGLISADLLVLLNGALRPSPDSPGRARSYISWVTIPRSDWEVFAQNGHSVIGLAAGLLGAHLGRLLAAGRHD